MVHQGNRKLPNRWTAGPPTKTFLQKPDSQTRDRVLDLLFLHRRLFSRVRGIYLIDWGGTEGSVLKSDGSGDKGCSNDHEEERFADSVQIAATASDTASFAKLTGHY